MFSKLLTWIRKQLDQIFGGALGNNDVAISSRMESSLGLWVQMYDNGGPWCTQETGIHSLDLAGSVASEYARLITMEMEVSFSGSARATYLQQQLTPFLDGIQSYVEYGCALGGIVFKPYVSGDHIVVDVVQADAFFPTTFDTSRNLTGAIFSEQIKRKNRIYTRLEHHEYANGKEVIANRAFESASIESLGREIPLTDVPEWAAIAPDATIENIDRPLFAYFRIPKANREDRHSPLGVSVFADAVAIIRDADRQYGSLLWEYDGGQMAIDADDTAIRHNTDGSTSLPKREKRLFRHVLSGSAHDRQTLYEVFAPQLRDENYRKGLDTMLKRIEFQCGLAYGTLSDPQSVDKTAEEVRNSKQRSYSSVKSIQTALQAALDDLIYAVNTYATMYQLAPAGEYKVAYDWDDSIVNDPAARKQMFWGYVEAGKFPMQRYLMEFEGYSEDDAKKIVEETQNEGGAADRLSFEAKPGGGDA